MMRRYLVGGVAALAAVCSVQASETDLSKRLSRLNTVRDGIVSKFEVSFRSKADPDGKDPLAMWRADAPETVVATGAFVRVDFTLVPEEGSCIRCRADLPLPDDWDGRLWGQGNSGRAGFLLPLKRYTSIGSAAVTTDLGTKEICVDRKFDKSVAWPAGILRDFHWRATHLMTVYGKRIVEAFYGRPCDHAYFCGGSTGGRQAISEATRFPEDYDGIIAILPDNNAAVSEIAIWHLWKATHDAAGNALFTADEMRVVADAAVEYRASSDPAPYAGFVVADGRFPEADIDGFLALAAKKCPSLAANDKIARLKSLYMPLMHDGRCYFNGFAPGTYHGVNMGWGSLVSMPHCLAAKGFVQSRWKDVGWKEIDEYLREYSPEFNAASDDLSAFRARGGKIIMTTGWEDQTIPPAPIIDYFERVCRRDGGIEKTDRYFRLFCIPGCAHGGGKGRGITGSPCGVAGLSRLVDWCEKGVAPESYDAWWAAKKLNVPVPPYPGLAVRDSAGKWSVRRLGRGGVAPLDPCVLRTKLDDLH